MRDPLGMLKSQSKNNIAEKLIRIWYDKAFELYIFKEKMMLFKNCEKMLVRETENRVENSEFREDEINVNLGQIAISGCYTKEV